MGCRHRSERIDKSQCSSAYCCKKCGLVYFDPQPSLAQLQSYYSREDEAGYANLLRGWTPQELGQDEKKSCIARLRELETHWLRKAPHGSEDRKARFIEVGIGNGHLLVVGRDELGWEVSGIELSHPLAEGARKSFGLDIIELDLSDASSAAPYSGTADIILMEHALEHTRHPGQVIRQLAEMLRPGGIAAIFVPNGGSLNALYGFETWGWGNYPEHLYFFTRSAFELSFSRAGMVCEYFDSRSFEGDGKSLKGILGRQINRDRPIDLDPLLPGLAKNLLLPELRVVARKPGAA